MSWGGCGEAKDSRGTSHRSPLSSGEPNRETTAGRDSLRRHAHFFAAAALSYYPSTRLHLVDTAINGTTCLAWSKGSTDKSARFAVLSGQGLPTPPQTDNRLVHLVKDTRYDPRRGPSRSGLCRSKRDESGHGHQYRPVSVGRDSLWWISDHL
jgi:hypothetical protein